LEFSDLARLAAKGHGAAQRVDYAVVDDQVEVAPGGAEGVVAGKIQLSARLPPAFFARDDLGMKFVIELGPETYGPQRRAQRHPLAIRNAPLPRSFRVQLEYRLRDLSPQTGD
jgi:hypothetical protein